MPAAVADGGAPLAGPDPPGPPGPCPAGGPAGGLAGPPPEGGGLSRELR
jgi:hypothetical protein